MDFFRISEKEARGGVIEIHPDFVVGRSTDLMVQGQSFYAIWNEEKGLWSRDEYDVPILVDKEIREHSEKLKAEGIQCNPKYLRSFNTNAWKQFRMFMKNVSDNSHPLDAKVTFANSEVKKTDYVSRRLPYSLAPNDISAYEELVSVLYTPEERAKFEWGIGSVIAGDARKIEKFLVFYGPGGTGKSTIMKIVQMIFGGLVKDGGYIATFDAKALVGNSNAFATSAFKDNPLVAIQHDGDLSRVEDNTVLNSIVSHEELIINEKFKSTYTSRINAMLFMGTNKPVKITDAKSGMIRRLIDVRPTGNKLDPDRYFELMARIEFELGGIAQHCLNVYKSMGKNAYNHYKPEGMMLETDVFYNFIVEHYDIFKLQDGTSLKQAYSLWKEYVVDAQLEYKMPMYKFREKLKDYFEEFHEKGYIVEGREVRSYYNGFSAKPFTVQTNKTSKGKSTLVIEDDWSVFDEICADQPAQYANADGTPTQKWENVRTKLMDLDTTALHYVKVPENHIVIDFDLRDSNGEKSRELNLEAASLWPPTYAEFSKSGGGVHLHYIYDGPDVGQLANQYSDGVEIKVYRGDASLRRKLTTCNSLPVSTINSGLPFKEKKTMQEPKTIQSEKGLRDMVARNLAREFGSTKSSVDFIKKLLDDAYKNGMVYDLTDMRHKIMLFANGSTNQALTCLKLVKQMKFKSEVTVEDSVTQPRPEDERVVYFDCEVFPNLFVICWKYEDSDTVVRMINPSAYDVESLFQLKLAGYNCRGYDNHIMYGASMGMSNQQLYELSQKIIKEKDRNAMYKTAYHLSYADVMDYCSVSPKPSLKWWEIKLGLHHMEMDHPWEQPVPPELWAKVVEYCVNDVVALEAVAKHIKQDFVARQILANLSGLSVNHTTRNHATKIIFGNERNPQKDFIYTDLRDEFPGYEFDQFAVEKSTYRGEEVGEGGFVYAEPGIHENVVLLDVASMHPTSIVCLGIFGKHTEKFERLLNARLAIKNGQRSEFERLLPGVAWPETEDEAFQLQNALKLVINSIYGFTAATFPNEFKDPRNVDNIVAKRGALFMIDLKNYAQSLGLTVAHIKTDSIKLPGATAEQVELIKEFGRSYGYTFDHEATYKKMCLANDAVYIAKVGWTSKKGDCNYWSATGSQFQHPTVMKALFTGETITFGDLCETKAVKGDWAMYLDYDDSVATPTTPYKGMHFVGKMGLFLPVYKQAGGAKLVKLKNGEGKAYDVQGTKGHLWLEADVVKTLNLNAVDRMLFEDLTQAVRDTGSITDIVDMSYFETLVQKGIETIEKFGSYSEFVK